MRIAVTGAAGYIGGWLIEELLSRGHKVYAQDKREPEHIGGKMERPTAWMTFDLEDADKRLAWLRITAPDVIVHLAALYGRVWGEKSLTATITANTALTAELARECSEHGIRLLFASSSEVYGEASLLPGASTTTSVLHPLNMYGLSKKWGEEACRLYCPEGLMIARLNMPYGPAKVHPRAGEIPGSSGRAGQIGYNVLHTMLWQARHGFDITVHTGTERSLTWVGDTVRGISVIIESGASDTWNVGRNDDLRPVSEIAQKVISLTGSSSRIVEMPLPPQVTRRKSLADGELRDLGWIPETSLDEGMKPTWDYFARFDQTGAWEG